MQLRQRDQRTTGVLLAISFVLVTFLTSGTQDLGAGKNFETKYRYQVDINTATPFELQTLPGIGETLANRIVEYREDSGPFESSEEIRNIKGIGEKKHATLLPYLLPFRAATVMKR